MFFSWSDTDWNLWGCLLSQALAWSLWVDWDQRLKWWQVFIYYNYRIVYPSHPFIGTRDAFGTAKNIISILFPLPTTCLWSLCSLWPDRGTERVSWPRGRNVRWLTSQARLDTLRQHGPVTWVMGWKFQTNYALSSIKLAVWCQVKHLPSLDLCLRLSATWGKWLLWDNTQLTMFASLGSSSLKWQWLASALTASQDQCKVQMHVKTPVIFTVLNWFFLVPLLVTG